MPAPCKFKYSADKQVNWFPTLFAYLMANRFLIRLQQIWLERLARIIENKIQVFSFILSRLQVSVTETFSKTGLCQCDQIGRFFKVLSNKFSYKSSTKRLLTFGQIWKRSINVKSEVDII